MSWLTLFLLTTCGSCFGQPGEASPQEALNNTALINTTIINTTIINTTIINTTIINTTSTDTAGSAISPASAQPGCDSYTMDNLSPLGFKRKACYYRDELLTGSAVFGAAFFGAMAQVKHDPSQWPQGADGFGRRFGTRYAQGIAKSTGSFLVGALNHEDPRPHPPANPECAHNHIAKTGFWPRTGDALLRTVWAHRDNCSDGIAFSHFAGALSSGFIGRAWLPDPSNSIGQAFARTGTAFGGDVAASIFSEFQGDIFGFFGRMFGSGKPKQ